MVTAKKKKEKMRVQQIKNKNQKSGYIPILPPKASLEDKLKNLCKEDIIDVFRLMKRYIGDIGTVSENFHQLFNVIIDTITVLDDIQKQEIEDFINAHQIIDLKYLPNVSLSIVESITVSALLNKEAFLVDTNISLDCSKKAQIYDKDHCHTLGYLDISPDEDLNVYHLKLNSRYIKDKELSCLETAQLLIFSKDNKVYKTSINFKQPIDSSNINNISISISNSNNNDDDNNNNATKIKKDKNMSQKINERLKLISEKDLQDIYNIFVEKIPTLNKDTIDPFKIVDTLIDNFNNLDDVDQQETNDFIKSCNLVIKLDNSYDLDYEISESISIKRGLPILKKDNIFIEISKDLCCDQKVQLYHGMPANVLGELTLEKDTTYSQKGKYKYYLTALAEDMNFNKLDKFSFVNILFYVDSQDPTPYSCEIEINCTEISTPEDRSCLQSDLLAIDFGTTNTTVGSYTDIDKIDIVTFETATNNELSKLYPTIVLVDDCSDVDNIKYKFGYEAKSIIESNNYLPQASFFYSLKGWIYDSEKIEVINDTNGFKAKVTRYSIIKQYLLNIIEFAEHHFGKKFAKLHFSTPVKQKHNYIKFFNGIFEHEYQVISANDAIDEGMSIVYGYIRKKIKSGEMQRQAEEPTAEQPKIPVTVEERKLLIIDSGGGTTDLSSVTFKVNSSKGNADDYELNIKTSYEKGASKFGGNNITYLIMKLIKIKLFELSKGKKENIILLGKNTNEILKDIDACNESVIYKDLDKAYEAASETIPTQFRDLARFNGKKQIKAVKQNFYLLWQIAEIVKIEFFRQSSVERITFTSENKLEGKIKLPQIENYDITLFKNNQIRKSIKSDIPNVSISLQEVKNIILPAIYQVIENLVNGDQTIEQNAYDAVVLSGQTSKINLYSELLKEFIPGKKLREALEQANDNDLLSEKDETLQLKIKCIEGAIWYFMDKEYGKIIPNIKCQNNKIHHKIRIDRNIDSNKEAWMYDLNNKYQIDKLNYQMFDPDTSIITKFLVYSVDNILSKELNYKFKGKNKPIALNKLIDTIKNTIPKKVIDNLKEKINNIQDNKKIILTIPDSEQYGFNIIEFDVIEQKFTEPFCEFVYFEDYDSEENSFFNGKF